MEKEQYTSWQLSPALTIQRDAIDGGGIPDVAQEREQRAQRRVDLKECKLWRELAAQKSFSEEQVVQLEKLHREQQRLQRGQYTQRLAAIQQQQTTALVFMKRCLH
uniref:Uncharacterized protein n=1 Tax=Hyaloperonospora arabidopsidis (strain Emoy2) TaxID=559515 RepID=M4B2X6_HYAAE